MLKFMTDAVVALIPYNFWYFKQPFLLQKLVAEYFTSTLISTSLVNLCNSENWQKNLLNINTYCFTIKYRLCQRMVFN